MGVLRCVESFAFTDRDGAQVVVAAGDLVDEKDRRIKIGTALRFEPVEVSVARKARAERVRVEKATDERTDVERAAAAPREKRAVKRASKTPRRAKSEAIILAPEDSVLVEAAPEATPKD